MMKGLHKENEVKNVGQRVGSNNQLENLKKGKDKN